MINVSLLGIKVGVDDAPTVGAFAMLVALVWFYVNVRRENEVIGLLLYESRTSPIRTQLRVFHGIISYAVFTNVQQYKGPFKNIDRLPKRGKKWISAIIMWILFYLPPVAVLLLTVLDVASFFSDSPFRPNELTIHEIMTEREEYAKIYWIYGCYGFSFILAILILLLCGRIHRYARATEKALRKYLKAIEAYVPPQATDAGGA